ncbi:DUF4974 domain-containing protein [Mucilaginibacter sp. cycad4]|uniref:FecR family protein n=1 Tax=Mucilaginibacter sp. cycad4 TaxID=3342096 RepID=UPI002AAB33AD|nr:FecR domain-containing protein [Mucilaginibacter gossypii]WPU99048.1 DUF4974 domain-containing protein [Mucilaginibacter gossypii]
MKESDAKKLLRKYNAGIATEDERSIVEGWYNSSEFFAPAPDNNSIEAANKRVWKRIDAKNSSPIKLLARIAAAASVLVMLSTGGYFLYQSGSSKESLTQASIVKPGHAQATLILANGQHIILSPKLKGNLATQGKVVLQAKGINGIAYSVNAKTSSPEIFNKLVTGRGEQSPFPITLSDGTKVWLNAESSLVFPVQFKGKERIVKLEGEGYFEVCHDKLHPFKVISRNQVTEDIGTKFNMNAYKDEPVITTTLLEGAVKINNNLIINPDEQSNLDQSGAIIVKRTDAEAAIAWKNGKFIFQSENLHAVMRKLVRWYNIEVIYQGDVFQKNITGSVSRFDDISKTLNKISFASGVHFKVEGRRITVIN